MNCMFAELFELPVFISINSESFIRRLANENRFH